MRYVHCLALGIFLSAMGLSMSNAQPPTLINYQGRLVDGTNLVNGVVGLTLQLMNAPTGGSVLYQTSNQVVVVDGLYQAQIGSNDVFDVAMDSALANTNVWLEVVVNGQPLSPRERVMSVPYARMVRGLQVSSLSSVAMNPGQYGFSANEISTNIFAATIGGGVDNVIVGSAHYAVVGGGSGNGILSNAQYATVSGGAGNSIRSFGGAIGGGQWNGIYEQATNSVIAGGWLNQVQNGAQLSAIGGGVFNLAQGPLAMIPGGSENNATNYAFAAGRRAKAVHVGSFVWADSINNDVGSTASNQVTFRAGGGFRVLGGPIQGDAGGLSNFPAAVVQNYAANSDGLSLTTNNSLLGSYSLIGGGQYNEIVAPYSTLAGGFSNRIINGSQFATIAGGALNTITMSDLGTIGGGLRNVSDGNFTTIGGGEGHYAAGSYSTIPGGYSNRTIGAHSFAAGRRAQALHDGSFVWADTQSTNFTSATNNEFAVRANGGVRLVTGGSALTVEGTVRAANGTPLLPSLTFSADIDTGIYRPSANALGFSAGGEKARISSAGFFGVGTTNPAAFVHISSKGTTPQLFLDQTDATNAFTRLRMSVGGQELWDIASGGTNNVLNFFSRPNPGNRMTLDTNGNLFITGTLNPPSDENLKQDFAPVEGREILDKLVAMPVQSWVYRHDPAARHIGPTAQDFQAAFGIGASDTSISTVDADGIALAAIQALAAENARLRERLEKLEQALGW
ncbi:MAG TPA: tail fiber domain-containing protein [Kiritimatiellia bacterium]|nr:tail fiber domain-containing protein [Kiritimatiellia bacterium]HMO99470.1 tail fiber domain-containing protein [Kiritimatiellia bacterium]HMP97077.1 tail fiber domain-containing protein [Kiritimatiellia bacterium]